MEINELNNLNTDNLATNSMDVKNYNPSDELNIGENNYDYGESLYAKKKRTSKVIKVVATTFAIGVTTLLGGTLITNLFNSSEESIEEVSNVEHEEDKALKISYDINNSKDLSIFLIIQNGEDEVYRHDSSKTDHYDYSIELTEDVMYTAKFVGFDNDKQIDYSNYSFSFVLRK